MVKLVPPNRHACVSGSNVVKISRPAVRMGRNTARSPVALAFGKSSSQPMCLGGESLALGGWIGSAGLAGSVILDHSGTSGLHPGGLSVVRHRDASAGTTTRTAELVLD